MMTPSITKEIRFVRDEQDVRHCWNVFKELRPHLKSVEEFVARWRSQINEGYQIVYIAEGDFVRAAAGYRFLHIDTGHQRHQAHRTYLRNGFRIDCHHLAWEVTRD